MRSRSLSAGLPVVVLLCAATLAAATNGMDQHQRTNSSRATIQRSYNSSSVPMVDVEGTIHWPDGRTGDPVSAPRIAPTNSPRRLSVTSSPGIPLCPVGTAYDYQSNDANQRTIATLGGGELVHFTWTHLNYIPDSLTSIDYAAAHQCYSSISGPGRASCDFTFGIFPESYLSRFSSIDVNSEGLPISAFSAYNATLQQRSAWLNDQAAPCNVIATDELLPGSDTDGLTWPHLAIDRNASSRDRSVSDVYHVTGQATQSPGPPLGIVYWRRVGDIGHSWEGPVMLDEHHTGTLNHYVAVDPSSDKVAVIYERANLVGSDRFQVGYLESPDNGANWISAGGFPNPIEPVVGPYVFVTSYTGFDGEGPQAWLECAGEYDFDGVLHIVWVEQAYSNTGPDCRIKHWSPTSGTSTIAEAVGWANAGEQGFRDLWLSLPNLAFGDGSSLCTNGPGDLSNYDYVYVTYQQYGGPTAAEANDVSSHGYQNAEIYLGVSNDGGNTWAIPVNLTGTPSQGCDGTVPGFECASEVNPSPAKTVNDTLHLMYILDRDAGEAIAARGSWTLNPVMYHRIPGGIDADIICPQLSPRISAQLSDSDPDCEYHAALNSWAGSQQVVEQLIISNFGNAILNGNISENPPADWLQLVAGPFTIPVGGADDARTVTMDAAVSLIQSNGEGLYQTTIEIAHNDTSQTSPVVIPIEFFVFDDFYCPEYLTLHTGWLWLTVSNLERVANLQPLAGGLVRLDPSVGDSSYGIYDGSLIIGVPPTPDTLVYRSVYGSGNGASGFRALGALEVDTSAYGTGAGYASARARQTTVDSLLDIDVEYVFPQDADSCEFVIINYRITNSSPAAFSGLSIGQATDFNVVPPPGDDSQIDNNNAGQLNLLDLNLIYQQGIDTLDELTRFKAGITSISCEPSPRAWCAPNTPWLTDRPGAGFHEGYLWQQMTQSGFEIFEDAGTGPDKDLHTVMVFENNVDLAAGDSRSYTMAYVSSNTGTDASDLVATTRKAWRYAFGWKEFTTLDSLPQFPPSVVSYPYRALGVHEDGLAGGCCGCIVTEVEDDFNKFEITPDADPCTGTIDLIEPVGGCLYTATFRVTDLCEETVDDITIEVTVGDPSSCDCPFQGDFDANFQFDAVDLNALIQILFFNETDPLDPFCPTTRGDVNSDGISDAVDLNYLIQTLFFNGLGPLDPCLVLGGC